MFSPESLLIHVAAVNWSNSWIDDQDELGDEEDDRFDPDRLAVCAHWRSGELFERRSANHRYSRKACRGQPVDLWVGDVSGRLPYGIAYGHGST